MLVPHPPGGRPRLVADHTHNEPCTKIARAGACSFLPISQREVSVLFFYLLKKDYRFMAGRAQRNMAGAEAARAVHMRARARTREGRGARANGDQAGTEKRKRADSTHLGAPRHTDGPATIAVAAPRMQSRAGKVEG